MLSRRSIRIKVMQLFFSLSRDSELDFKVLKKRYWEAIDSSYNLYLYSLYIFVGVTQHAEEDESNRKAKHLPTEKDKLFSAKLFNNSIIQDIHKNKLIQAKFKKMNFAGLMNTDYVKKLYYKYSKSDEYNAYLQNDSEKKDHLEVLLDLFRFVRKEEMFEEMMEDSFPNWVDDKSVIIGTIKKTLKALPTKEENFFEAYYPDDETIKDFGENLLIKTHKQDEELLSEIKPTLKNWDHERVAVIDMILLKMAVNELLGFETIPTKVTINEYVEVAKLYSTAKSKEFINGILDAMMKEMVENGKINKEGRGLLN